MRINKKNKTQLVLLLLIFVYLFSVGMGVVHFLMILGAESVSSTGSFQINADPGDVTGVDFQNDTYDTISALDPDASTWWRLNFTVNMASGIGDVHNVTIWIFDDSVHANNYNTTSPTGTTLVEFDWLNDTDTWTMRDQGSLTAWSVDSANSDDPGSAASETQFEFSMRFRVSRCADYNGANWNATIHVFDGDSPAKVGYGAETSLITVNQYFEITISSGTFSWGTAILPDSTNNTHGALTWTVWANDNWEIEINGSDFTAPAQDPVDIETNDTVVWDEDGVEGGTDNLWLRNTQSVCTGGWDNQSPVTTDAGVTDNIYLFLNPAQLFASGVTWSIDVQFDVQANT